MIIIEIKHLELDNINPISILQNRFEVATAAWITALNRNTITGLGAGKHGYICVDTRDNVSNGGAVAWEHGETRTAASIIIISPLFLVSSPHNLMQE